MYWHIVIWLQGMLVVHSVLLKNEDCLSRFNLTKQFNLCVERNTFFLSFLEQGKEKSKIFFETRMLLTTLPIASE